jgi:hypothetical protein
MALYNNFLKLGERKLQSSGVVVGVFYGHKGLLTDKYRIIRGENVRRQSILKPLSYVKVKAGAEFWTWLNDDETRTQEWILEGIQKGVDEFSANNPSVREVVGGASNLLVKELRDKYGLPDDGSLDWFFLLHAVNDEREGVGEEDNGQTEL